MNEHHDDQERHPPRWVPYTPPSPDGWDRLRLLIRRLSFPAVVLFLLAGVASVLFYWEPLSGADERPPPVVSVEPSAGLGEEGALTSTAAPARLRVRSSPDGATVRVNGDSVGVTPFTDSTRQPGVYLLSVRYEGHFRADSVVVLDDGSRAFVRFDLRPRPGYAESSTEATTASADSPPRAAPQRSPSVAAVPPSRSAPPPTARPVLGALYVTSVPTGARVTVNGEERGRTPLPLSKIQPGQQQIALFLDGYQSWTSQVEVQADTTARVHAKLQPQTGRLRVLARPWGTIYINETLHARESDVWYETNLPAGSHRITVVHPVLGEQSRPVDVQVGGEHSIIVDLRSDDTEPKSP